MNLYQQHNSQDDLMRIKKDDLKFKEERVNTLLARVGVSQRIEIQRRNDLYCIDFTNGDVVQEGLTAREAYFLLRGIEVVYTRVV